MHARDHAHGIAYPGPPVPARFAAALVATEDHRFYSDPGIDPVAVGRVALGYLSGQGSQQGGATITQQLAKMLYTPGRSGLASEIEQVVMAVKLNFSYSKAQIGLDAYYKWVNDQGGVNGRKIETVLEDYACDSAKGVAAVKKLIYQDKVFMLHGNSCSAVAMAIKPIVVESGIPWVIAHAANPAISSPPTKNIFHGVPVGKTMGIAMGQFVASKPGLTKVAVISHTDDWAKSYCVPANEYLASKNIKPVVEVAFERGQTDATAQTLRIKQANPDFVIACLYEAETAIFLKDAKKYGLNVPVMGTAGTDLENTIATGRGSRSMPIS